MIVSHLGRRPIQDEEGFNPAGDRPVSAETAAAQPTPSFTDTTPYPPNRAMDITDTYGSTATTNPFRSLYVARNIVATGAQMPSTVPTSATTPTASTAPPPPVAGAGFTWQWLLIGGVAVIGGLVAFKFWKKRKAAKAAASATT